MRNQAVRRPPTLTPSLPDHEPPVCSLPENIVAVPARTYHHARMVLEIINSCERLFKDVDGYWVAKQDGREVARGSTANEAYQAAISQGATPDRVVMEFVYTTDRI